MADFRFQGVVPSGKMVQGTITATNAAEAKKKILELSKGRAFRLNKLEKRVTFIYKAQKGEKILEGDQKAYSKAEVESALTSMGYKVLYVRKKLQVSMGKPPVTDLITFVRLSADLLREKLPFNEVLNLLANDIENKTLKETLKDINADLRKGAESERVFLKYEHVLGKFTSKMLGLASKSGAMAEMYDSTAKFLERRMEEHEKRHAHADDHTRAAPAGNDFLCGIHLSRDRTHVSQIRHRTSADDRGHAGAF